MWRALFLAMGIYVLILGAQCLGVQKFVLRMRVPVEQQIGAFVDPEPELGPNRVLVPAPWVPWSLMSSGAVVCLYSFTIPARVNGKGK